jgi:hypothetical protein
LRAGLAAFGCKPASPLQYRENDIRDDTAATILFVNYLYLMDK